MLLVVQNAGRNRKSLITNKGSVSNATEFCHETKIYSSFVSNRVPKRHVDGLCEREPIAIAYLEPLQSSFGMSKTLQELRQDVVDAGKLLFQKGWIAANDRKK